MTIASTEAQRDELIVRARAVLADTSRQLLRLGVDYHMAKAHFREVYLEVAIEAESGHKSRAARVIGCHRNRLIGVAAKRRRANS